jgi:hypothetical protein
MKMTCAAPCLKEVYSGYELEVALNPFMNLITDIFLTPFCES